MRTTHIHLSISMDINFQGDARAQLHDGVGTLGVHTPSGVGRASGPSVGQAGLEGVRRGRRRRRRTAAARSGARAGVQAHEHRQQQRDHSDLPHGSSSCDRGILSVFGGAASAVGGDPHRVLTGTLPLAGRAAGAGGQREADGQRERDGEELAHRDSLLTGRVAPTRPRTQVAREPRRGTRPRPPAFRIRSGMGRSRRR